MISKRLYGTILITLFLAMSIIPANALEFGSKELVTEMVAIKLTREVLKGKYDVVRTDELKKWIDEGKNIFILDSTPLEKSYSKRHIPGAMQFEFPKKEMDKLSEETVAEFEKLLGEDKKRLIVVYCGFTKCGRSHNAAMWAKKLGYENVYRYPGGIKAWGQADYPVESIE